MFRLHYRKNPPIRPGLMHEGCRRGSVNKGLKHEYGLIGLIDVSKKNMSFHVSVLSSQISVLSKCFIKLHNKYEIFYILSARYKSTSTTMYVHTLKLQTFSIIPAST